MHITTIIFFALLAFFTWRGYQKGFIGSITRVLGWIVAYPAAIVFTKPVAKLIMQHTSLDGLIVYFIAGSAIFLLVSFLVSLLLNLLAKLIPETDATQVGSRIGGASVGVLMGALVGLLVVYAIGLVLTPKPQPLQQESLDDISQIDNSVITNDTNRPPATSVPHVRDLAKSNDSFIEASAKKLMGNAAATAVDLALDDKTTTQITKAFVENPQSMLTHVQQVANDGQMKELMADEKIQSILTTGDTNALLRDPGFQELMNNPSVQALMSQSDVKSEAGAQAAAEKMVQAWSRVQTIKHDPRVIAIISDPEFQQQMNSSNKLPLMMNPKLNQLTEIIFSSETTPANGMGTYQVRDINEVNTGANTVPATNNSADDAKPAKTIYRWTDDNGQVHYSDKPIKTK
ncbi:MAG TPA: colicin V production CvpA [Cellvibrio sp.]|uniref:CvpA family protein n=1 Tax=Cellvibrio sp. TaxID=1965322 RepID=UPI000ECF7F27|nr:CvpA family protein [Cellvibrio sp.]HCS64406.1 colicin V production CvpA [Cellvibrio sp.]